MNLKPYKFSNDELKILKRQYPSIRKNVDLSAIDKNILEKITDACGVYFWLMNYENQQYKIYIGKTNSLRRRLNDYKVNFQIHSPNDFKLRFFQEFTNKHLQNSSLDLHFMECSIANYTKEETNAINLFRPMINARSKTNDETQLKIQQAFKEYYEEIFFNKLK